METENKLTYEEFKAQCLRDIPEEQHATWLAENEIVPAPLLEDGWMVMNKSEMDQSSTDGTGTDDLQEYEHSKEIE